MAKDEEDLSKIASCVRRLCGKHTSNPPPVCDDWSDCPGKLWRMMQKSREMKKNGEKNS